MKKRKPPANCEVMTLAQRKKFKPKLVDVKFFVLPWVKINYEERTMTRGPIGPFGLEKDAQARLEEMALLARWRRKHQPVTGGSRSAGRPGAACKRSSGRSRRASR
jgi:hypothetical protein